MNPTIDTGTCTRCGICAEICPMGIIEPATETTPPRVQERLMGICVNCGHCEAFCPTGALVQASAGEGARIGWAAGKSPALSADHLGTYIRSRRSVRQYRPEPVPRETIEDLLDIARYAPSGGNGQPVEWLVIHDRNAVLEVGELTIAWMHELAKSTHPMARYAPHLIRRWEEGVDVICQGAPHLLVPHIPADSQIAPVDATIALTTVDIAAPSFGLGTCWAGFVAMASRVHPPLQEYFALPEGRVPAYAMMLGYPRFWPHQLPGRKPATIQWQESPRLRRT